MIVNDLKSAIDVGDIAQAVMSLHLRWIQIAAAMTETGEGKDERGADHDQGLRRETEKNEKGIIIRGETKIGDTEIGMKTKETEKRRIEAKTDTAIVKSASTVKTVKTLLSVVGDIN